MTRPRKPAAPAAQKAATPAAQKAATPAVVPAAAPITVPVLEVPDVPALEVADLVADCAAQRDALLREVYALTADQLEHLAYVTRVLETHPAS